MQKMMSAYTKDNNPVNFVRKSEVLYADKNGNHYLGRSRIILVGILYAGPQYNAQGDLVVTTIPTQQKVQTLTPIMTNLGYYVKATELKEFEDYIAQNIK